MFDIVSSTRFRRDLKLAIKRGYKIELLDHVVGMLAAGEKLPEILPKPITTNTYFFP